MFNCQVSNNNLTSSTPWRNFSDSAFASSQGSLSNCSLKDDIFYASQNVAGRSIFESPVHKIYHNYVAKEALHTKTNTNAVKDLKEVNVASFLCQETHHQETLQITSMLSVLSKELLDKLDHLEANVNEHFLKLKINIDENHGSNVEQCIRDNFEKLFNELRVSINERSRIAELENIINQKDQEIQMLSKQLQELKEDGIQKVVTNFHRTFISEIEALTTTIHKSKSFHSQEIMNLKCILDESVSSVKDAVIQELRLSFVNQKENTSPALVTNEVDVNRSYLCDNRNIHVHVNSSMPKSKYQQEQRSTNWRTPTDKSFEQLKKEFDCPLQLRNTRLTVKKPQKRQSRYLCMRSTPKKGTTPWHMLRAHLSKNSACSKRTPLKLIRLEHPYGYPNFHAHNAGSRTWNYRGNSRVSECSFDFTEQADSLSEQSSPSYSIKALTGLSPITDTSENEMMEVFENIAI